MNVCLRGNSQRAWTLREYAKKYEELLTNNKALKAEFETLKSKYESLLARVDVEPKANNSKPCNNPTCDYCNIFGHTCCMPLRYQNCLEKI